MNRTGTAIAESRQVIRDFHAAFSRLCTSVARADAAIAEARRTIEKYQASAPAMMDRADEATPARAIIDHPQVSRTTAMGKMAIDCDARKVAARIAQGLREAGFGCELLSPPHLH
jgi:hypothetical protein